MYFWNLILKRFSLSFISGGRLSIILFLQGTKKCIKKLMFSQHAENTCGCRPWHVPSEDGAKMCFVVGNVCFNQASSCSCFQDDFLVLDFVLLSYQFVDNCLHRPLKMILYTQVMEKIRVKKIFPTCSCKSDCVGWALWKHLCIFCWNCDFTFLG